VGHHYWDLLVRDGGQLDACREVFDDDTVDYGAALRRYYHDGPPSNYPGGHVSAYATAHPWEDFAETWAHYLHIVDTLEMAANFGMQVAPGADRIGGLRATWNSILIRSRTSMWWRGLARPSEAQSESVARIAVSQRH
jgi:hypothetical protein